LARRYLKLTSGKADYETCSTQTGYINLSSYIGDVTPGVFLCFQTSDNRYSAIKVLAIDNAGATLDIVTYDPPFK
jgi:hypothetical protein